MKIAGREVFLRDGGRSGQCCLRARLTERQRRGVEERRWTAALRLWNGGVWCREEQHLCPINQSHQNHIITTFSDTLIILLHMGKKNKRRVGEESEKALSHILCAFSCRQPRMIVTGFELLTSFKQWQLLQSFMLPLHGWLEYLTLIGQSMHSENMIVEFIIITLDGNYCLSTFISQSLSQNIGLFGV